MYIKGGRKRSWTLHTTSAPNVKKGLKELQFSTTSLTFCIVFFKTWIMFSARMKLLRKFYHLILDNSIYFFTILWAHDYFMVEWVILVSPPIHIHIASWFTQEPLPRKNDLGRGTRVSPMSTDDDKACHSAQNHCLCVISCGMQCHHYNEDVCHQSDPILVAYFLDPILVAYFVVLNDWHTINW